MARRVLQMKYAGGLKIRDIASGLARSVAAVEMMLVRSRRELRECIAPGSDGLQDGEARNDTQLANTGDAHESTDGGSP